MIVESTSSVSVLRWNSIAISIPGAGRHIGELGQATGHRHPVTHAGFRRTDVAGPDADPGCAERRGGGDR